MKQKSELLTLSRIEESLFQKNNYKNKKASQKIL